MTACPQCTWSTYRNSFAACTLYLVMVSLPLTWHSRSRGLAHFVQIIETLYGKTKVFDKIIIIFSGTHNCTINVHLLQHMAHYVKLYGPLWTHSCFPFEGYNGRLLKMYHGTQYVSLQVSICPLLGVSLNLAFFPKDCEVLAYAAGN